MQCRIMMFIDVKTMPVWLGWFLTFNFVNVAWVFFRAPDFDSAVQVLTAMFAPNKFEISSQYLYNALVLADNPLFSIVVTGLNTAVLWLAPLMILITVFDWEVTYSNIAMLIVSLLVNFVVRKKLQKIWMFTI